MRSPWWKQKHTSRECKIHKEKAKDKYNPKYATKYYKKNSRELNLLEREAAHQRAKSLKYKKINKAFAKKETPKEETIIIYETSNRDSSSSSEAYNSRDEDEKASIAYDSEYADNDEISNISIGREGNIWLNGCRYGFIINKVNIIVNQILNNTNLVLIT